jgi:hypothetical protein
MLLFVILYFCHVRNMKFCWKTDIFLHFLPADLTRSFKHCT